MTMSIKEIESAISQLPASEVAKLAEWFFEYQAQLWDSQIEHDVQAGKLDKLINQAENDFAAGRCKTL